MKKNMIIRYNVIIIKNVGKEEIELGVFWVDFLYKLEIRCCR